MDLDKIPFRPTIASAFYALMPYLIANAYLTLVVNWPGMAAELYKLDLKQMSIIPQLNFIYCCYAIFVILLLLTERWMGAFVVHMSIVGAFILGIGIIYAVIVPLQVLVNPYISGALILNSIIAIFSMCMFYYEVIRRWWNKGKKQTT